MLLCSVRQYGSIYKAYLACCFVLRPAPSLYCSLHFVTSQSSLHCMKTSFVRSRARSSNRHLRTSFLNSVNALEVLQSSSVFLMQWLHRFEGAWYASIAVASQIGHALQILGAGSVRSARRLTTSTRYVCLRYLIYFAV